MPGARRLVGKTEQFRSAYNLIELAQVVEQHLWSLCHFQRLALRPITPEVPQEAITEPPIRDFAKLLLDRLESCCRIECLLQLDPTGNMVVNQPIVRDRSIVCDFLPTVTLKLNQKRLTARALLKRLS